jgi:hypothetical protein
MSYASLFKTLPETLGSSTSLAAIASLGIHGLLLAILPVLPFESKPLETPSQRTVGLVELTPAEQSRLPQVATSDVTLPPFATQQSALPPLPPPPPIQTGIFPSQPLPQSFQLAPNKAISGSSQGTSSQTKTFTVSPLTRNTAPTRIAINNPTPRQNPQQPLRSGERLPEPRRSNWRQPRVSGLPSTRGLTAQGFDPSSFPPSPPLASLPSPPPLVPESPIPPQNSNPVQTQQSQNQSAAPNPQPPTPATRSPQGFENTKRELLARRDQLARANRATSPAPQNTPEPGRQKLETALKQRLQSPPQSNPTSTSASAALAMRQLDEYKAQQQKVQADNPKVISKRPVRQSIKTCDRALDGSVAYINAVVNPQGSIVSGPDLYSKTGTIDTQQAMALVKSYAFSKANNTTSYDFAIAFKYNKGNCSEPTTQSSPENSDQSQS